jgi:hypothetical protein
MQILRLVRVLPLLASILSLPAAFAASKADLEQVLSYDGLQKISIKDVDQAYMRPGASLAGYKRVMLDPVEVAFRKDWDPKRTGSNIKLSAEERESIRQGVAKIVHDEFVNELQSKSTYAVVNETGTDVLRVRASIVNLYVTAPDVLSSGPTKAYTISPIEMTLFAELFDSETGEIIARVVDRRQARATGMATLTTKSVNAAEARAIASAWARILRNGLDKAHGIGKK